MGLIKIYFKFLIRSIVFSSNLTGIPFLTDLISMSCEFIITIPNGDAVGIQNPVNFLFIYFFKKISHLLHPPFVLFQLYIFLMVYHKWLSHHQHISNYQEMLIFHIHPNPNTLQLMLGCQGKLIVYNSIKINHYQPKLNYQDL